MRITESRIRRIIREELEKQVDEMAYAGGLGARPSPDKMRQSFVANTILGDENRSGAERYAQSAGFRKLAEKHFANIPYQVWTAPLIGSMKGVYDSAEGGRMTLVPLEPDGIMRLEELGYKVPAQVGGDDVVILYTTMVTDKDYLATPWMIVHAMFDGDYSMGKVCPGFWRIVSGLMNGDADGIDPALLPLTADWDIRWGRALTMRSAREGYLSAATDAYAEIMCQELLTQRGFRINDQGADPKYVEALHALKPYVKQAADEFRRNVRGKLITVAVN